MRLFEAVFENSDTPQDKTALIYERGSFSYEDLQDKVTGTSKLLRELGVFKGSKIILSLINSPDFIVSLFAINKAEAIFVPLNPHLKQPERERITHIARPDFIISEQGKHRILPGIYLSKFSGPTYGNTSDPADLCALLFTSGTTGAPKGVMMADDGLLSNAQSVIRYLSLTDQDRTLVFLPLYYSYSFSQYLTALLAGGTVVLVENLLYPQRALEVMEKYDVTGFGGVPTTLNILANHPSVEKFELDSLRYVLNAGGPISPSLIRQLTKVFPKTHVINNYGCTEIGPRATYVDYTEFPEKIGSIGKPIPGVEVALIRDDLTMASPMEMGEIVLKGPSLMKGYYRNSECARQRMSSWGFHTGDYAYADESGFLYIQGRRDDMFKCGGEKVSAKEIEDVFLEHPDVFEAAVVSREDPAMGAVPVAYIVVKNPETVPSERALQAFCSQRLSRYKLPRQIHFVDSLEKSSTGKIQKYRLMEAVS